MKKGDFVTSKTLRELGYSFHSWFAGHHVYRKLTDDGDVDYVFHDFIKQEVVTTLKSKQ